MVEIGNDALPSIFADGFRVGLDRRLAVDGTLSPAHSRKKELGDPMSGKSSIMIVSPRGPIFVDGFESGATSSRSSTTP